jgi:hypothetical protein
MAVIVFSICAFVTVGLPVHAQSATDKKPRVATHPTRLAYQTLPSYPQSKNSLGSGGDTFAYERLTKAPTELPNLPNYAPPNSTYVFGMKSTQRGAIDLQLYFDSHSDADSIMKTYAAYFSQPGWKITYNKDNSLSAGFRTYTCTVRAQRAFGKTASRVMINYQFRPDTIQ